MKIIQKFDSTSTTESLNNSIINNLSIDGVSIPAVFNRKGHFIIMGMDGRQFIKQLPQTDKILNFHMYSKAKLTAQILDQTSYTLHKTPTTNDVILSSSQFFRPTLNKIRHGILMKEWNFHNEGSIIVAACGNISDDDYYNDMIYSSRNRSDSPIEFDRLLETIDNGNSVLIDWTDYDKKHTSRLLSLTNHSDKVLLLTTNPDHAKKIYSK